MLLPKYLDHPWYGYDIVGHKHEHCKKTVVTVCTVITMVICMMHHHYDVVQHKEPLNVDSTSISNYHGAVQGHEIT